MNLQQFSWGNFVLQLLRTVIALVAIVLAYRQTLAQVRASTVSLARMKWIGDLRSAVADLVTVQAYLMGSRTVTGDGLSEFLPELKEHILSLCKCRLLLDPADAADKELLEILDAASKSSMSSDFDGDALKKSREQIIEKTVQIIVTEWHKVKGFK